MLSRLFKKRSVETQKEPTNPSISVGDRFIYKNDIGNPFDTSIIVIVEYKDGWVLYRYENHTSLLSKEDSVLLKYWQKLPIL
jgi:hypothetical protein